MRLTFSQKLRLGEIISHNMTVEMKASRIMQNGQCSDVDVKLLGQDIDELQRAFEMFKMLAVYVKTSEPQTQQGD